MRKFIQSATAKIKLFKIEILVMTFVFAVLFPPQMTEALIYDDMTAFIQNPLFNPINWSNFFQLMSVPEQGVLYTPVTYTYWSMLTASFQALGISLGGSTAAVIIKIFSILLHLICVSFVWKLLTSFVNENKYSPGILAGVLIFALHPIHTETIYWITDAKDLLLKIFCCAYFLQIYRSKHVSAVMFLTLAIFTKQQAVVLPVAGLILAYIFGLNKRRFFLYHTIAIIPCAWMMYVSIVGQNTNSILNQQYPINSIYLISDTAGFYLKKLFIPFELAADYGRTNKFLYLNKPIIESAIFTLFCAVFYKLWIGYKNDEVKKNYLSALTMLFVPLIPVLGAIPFTSQVYSNVANRYASVSVFGFSLLATLIIRKFEKKKIVQVLTVLIISSFAYVTFNEKFYWADNKTFIQESLKRNEQSLMALNNAALAAGESGNFKEASEYLKKVLSENPNFIPGLLNAAKVETKLGNIVEAERHLKHAERLPTGQYSNTVYYEYGLFLEKQGRAEEAVSRYLKAVEINPKDARAHFRIGTIYIFKKEYSKSLEHLKIAAGLNPNNLLYLNTLKTVEKIISQ